MEDWKITVLLGAAFFMPYEVNSAFGIGSNLHYISSHMVSH